MFSLFVALYALSVSLTGCGGSSDNSLSQVTDAPVTTRSQYGPLEFTLTAPKTKYAKGEDVAMTFTVKNLSNKAVFLAPSMANPASPYIHIRQNNETVFGPFPQGPNIGIISSRYIAAGETQIQYVYRSQIKQAQISDARENAPSGVYQFYTRLGARQVDENLLSDEEIEQLLGPASIEITVK